MWMCLLCVLDSRWHLPRAHAFTHASITERVSAKRLWHAMVQLATVICVPSYHSHETHTHTHTLIKRIAFLVDHGALNFAFDWNSNRPNTILNSSRKKINTRHSVTNKQFWLLHLRRKTNKINAVPVTGPFNERREEKKKKKWRWKECTNLRFFINLHYYYYVGIRYDCMLRLECFSFASFVRIFKIFCFLWFFVIRRRRKNTFINERKKGIYINSKVDFSRLKIQ